MDFLSSNHGALLADEMGLGKTVQTATAIEKLLGRPEINRILVVAPSSLRLNWEDEIHHWAPNTAVRRVTGTESDRLATYMLPIPVLIASYEQIRQDSVKMRSDQMFDLVILDEAQRIKNAGSSLSLACKLLPRKRSWALTGTPIENAVEDLLAIFSFLSPGLLRVHMPRSQMHKTIQPFFLRRRKRDVLGEMPPINIQDIPLELEGEQLAAYEQVWNDRNHLLEDYGSSGGSNEVALLAILTRLKQLCNYDPVSGISAKMDVLEAVVGEAIANGTKCLIFSQYVETLNFIAGRLPGAISVFHGGLSEAVRASILATFEAEPGPRSLLISLKAGGVGLNLNSASLVVLFDRWWNPAVENQAITRAHRFGKTDPLQVIRFVVKNTIEERIASILEDKSELFEQYVESADNWKATSIDGHDIRKILQIV